MNTITPFPSKTKILTRTARNISDSALRGITVVVASPMVGMIPYKIRTDIHNYILPNYKVDILNNLSGLSSIIVEGIVAYNVHDKHPFVSGLIAVDTIVRISGTLLGKICDKKEFKVDRSLVVSDTLCYLSGGALLATRGVEKFGDYLKKQYYKARSELL